MARNAVTSDRPRSLPAPVKYQIAADKAPRITPVHTPAADAGCSALIQELPAMPAPLHEPEVVHKQQVTVKGKARLKTKPKDTAKSKIKLPAKVAKKTANKGPAKRAPSAKSIAQNKFVAALAPQLPLAEIFENNAYDFNPPGYPAARAANATDTNPPWQLLSADAETAQTLTPLPSLSPLPRNAALQVYSKNNWLSGAKYWVRNNLFSLFARQQKVVSVHRPMPKKLHPRDMITELNRLAEENRALRRQIMQINSDT